MTTENHKNIDPELAARILCGEADDIDYGLLQQWLEASSANREEWQKIQDTWSVSGEALQSETIDTDDAWKRVQRFTAKEEPVHAPKLWLRKGVLSAVAASVLVILGVVLFLFSGGDDSTSLTVANSGREEMVLSDGSAVTLNAGSKLECQQPFDLNERIVTLEGEGYFRVEGNVHRPFVIHTGPITIRVTGTRFNVRAYPNIDVVEVGVLEGQVEVVPPTKNDELVLNGGHTAVFYKKTGQMKVKPSNDPNLLAWITQKISFRETPLDEVAETLSRVYNVDVQLSNQELASEKLTARFSDNSLDFVLEVICATFNLEVRREGQTIFLEREPAR